MADNPTLVQRAASFIGNLFSDFKCRALEKAAGIYTQVLGIDIGGSGTESLLSHTNPLPVITKLPSSPDFGRATIANNSPIDALVLNTDRVRAFLINNTAATFWIKEGEDAALNEGFSLTSSGQWYEILSTERVSVIQNSGGPLDLDYAEFEW